MVKLNADHPVYKVTRPSDLVISRSHVHGVVPSSSIISTRQVLSLSPVLVSPVEGNAGSVE